MINSTLQAAIDAQTPLPMVSTGFQSSNSHDTLEVRLGKRLRELKRKDDCDTKEPTAKRRADPSELVFNNRFHFTAGILWVGSEHIDRYI